MSNRAPDTLYQLIRSLEKAEKRHFKLYITRSSSNEELKIVQLFDAIDKLKEYDEKVLLKKLPGIQKGQLSNLKAHLYKQILSSLRLLKSTDSIDLQLNEQFDHAHILYKKGLFLQSLRLIDKAKELAKTHQKFSFLIQLLGLEKRIEALHITRNVQHRADGLAAESIEVIRQVDMVARLSNLAIQLYAWYVKNGLAKNEADEASVRQYLKEQLPSDAYDQPGFYERMYLFQSLAWFAFIRQDFLMYYRYSKKWKELFLEDPLMKRVETGHYIKGMHNLLNAQFYLRDLDGFSSTLEELEQFSITPRVQQNDNFRIQSFLYISQARLDRYFLKGEFAEGLAIVPEIKNQLAEYSLFIDNHQVLVLNYKIAALYFGSGDHGSSIDYLQKIINDPVDLRYDIQCYARLMHLLAHYELGNFELLEYLSRSVYRFMAKMQNLSRIEEEMLNFLRRSFSMSDEKIRRELKTFLGNLKQFENNRFDTRAFVHLDIISWLQSKVHKKPLGQVVNQKLRKQKIATQA